eukprot:146120-Hanusia_phi.AAC.1
MAAAPPAPMLTWQIVKGLDEAGGGAKRGEERWGMTMRRMRRMRRRGRRSRSRSRSRRSRSRR